MIQNRAAAPLHAIRRLLAGVVAMLGGLLVASASLADIQYLYDAAGRLTGVVTDDGSAAVYEYDATGNITGIERVGAAAVSLLEFSPDAAPAGAEVTLWGAGFDATAGANEVDFNGAAAEVISASPNKLAVRVPAGASTGRIGVVTAAGRGTSRTDFRLLASDLSPTITGFSPALGAAGEQISLAGSGFQPGMLNNRVRVNTSTAAVRSATGTQLTALVPVGATSGPLSVTTRHGVARSGEDFYVVPADKTAADITHTSRVVIGAEASVTLAQKKTGLVLFHGNQGQRLYLVASPVEFSGGVTLNLLAPNAKVLLTRTLTTADTMVLAPLPITGTYTLRLDALSSTGRVTLAVKAVAPVTLDGASITAATQRNGENLVFSLQGRSGQWLSLGMVNQGSVSGLWSRLRVLLPDGSGWPISDPLSCNQIYTGANSCSLRNLPVGGVYTLIVDPQGDGTVGTVLTASTDVPGTLAADGTPFTFATQRSGQNARLTFEASAGQHLSVTFTENGFAGAMGITLWAPDGTEVRGDTRSITGTGLVRYHDLPAKGRYVLQVAPKAGSSGAVKVSLQTEAQETLEIDGDTKVLNLRPGQYARLTLNASAGQWLGLGVEADYGTGSRAYMRIIGPDGKQLSTYVPYDCNRYISRADRCALRNLPRDGVYQVEITPETVSATTLRITLSADLVQSIEANGDALTFASQRAGQNGRFVFEGVAGQRVTAALIGNTFPDDTQVMLYAPNGSQVFGSGAVRRDAGLTFSPLPADGTYALWVAPAKLHLASTGVRLARDHASSIEVDGAPVTVDLLPAQNARFTFQGRAGQWLGLGINSELSASGSHYVSILRPDGKALDTTSPKYCTAWWSRQDRCSLRNLPLDGTYVVVIDPEGVTPTRLTLALSADVSPAVQVNGDPVTYATQRIGQNARLMIDGEAGQLLSVALTDNRFAGAMTLALFGPDGARLAEKTGLVRDSTADFPPLPRAGTYTVWLSPAGTAVGSTQVHLSSEFRSAGNVDGDALDVTLRPGQNARLTVTARAGDFIGLGIRPRTDGGVMPSVYVTLVKPDGKSLDAAWPVPCSGWWSSASRCTLANLPAEGEYTVLLDPSGVSSADLSVTFNTDTRVNALINGASVSAVTHRQGQATFITFDALAGQRHRVLWSESTFALARLHVFEADGRRRSVHTLNGASARSGSIDLGLLTGSYTLYVEPVGTNLGSVDITLTSP